MVFGPCRSPGTSSTQHPRGSDSAHIPPQPRPLITRALRAEPNSSWPTARPASPEEPGALRLTAPPAPAQVAQEERRQRTSKTAAPMKRTATTTAPLPTEGGPQTLSTYIQARFDEFSRSQKDVAQYIVDHLDEVAFQTAEELARRANTSSSTVVRFSQAL